MDSIASPKVTTIEGERVGARSLARSTLGVKKCVRAPWWDKENCKQVNYLHELAQTKQQVG
jgi:hypothetical protein